MKNKTVAKKVDKRSVECKGFDHMRNESLNKEKEEEKKRKREKRKRKENHKKILKPTMESIDEENLEEFLNEFCFISNDDDEEIGEELQTTFKAMNEGFINVGEMNKDLRLFVESLSSENEELKAKITKFEREQDELITINKELIQQV